ncbi:MAG: hypothetical protein ABJD07_07900 [Gemmatimonadaceae bacterium]
MALRARLAASARSGALPGSLLIQGRRGIGKQRLALWLGQLLLCSAGETDPCGKCASCRYSTELQHPDLRWFFPRPRLLDADAALEEVQEDYAEAIAERVKGSGLYPPSSGTEGIFVSTVRALVRMASMTPSMANRKVFIVGEAERMVPQEGSEFAANAFLKLLEEPPADTTLILTSSEPGALLPTIRSRIVSIRATPLSDNEMDAFAADPAVKAKLPRVDTDWSTRRQMSGGSPGGLLAGERAEVAVQAARTLLAAISGSRADRMKAVTALGGSKARGFFSEMLDALTVLLRDRAREAARRDDGRRVVAASRAVDVVEAAKLRAAGNVNPQLIGAALAGELAELLA